MLVHIVGLKPAVSKRQATIVLKNSALNGRTRISEGYASKLVNMIADGQTMYLSVPHPQMVMKQFILSQKTMREYRDMRPDLHQRLKGE